MSYSSLSEGMDRWLIWNCNGFSYLMTVTSELMARGGFYPIKPLWKGLYFSFFTMVLMVDVSSGHMWASLHQQKRGLLNFKWYIIKMKWKNMITYTPPLPLISTPHDAQTHESRGVSGNLKMGACSRTHVRSDALAAGKLCTICSSPIPSLYNMVKPNTTIVQYGLPNSIMPLRPATSSASSLNTNTNPPRPTHCVPSHPPML